MAGLLLATFYAPIRGRGFLPAADFVLALATFGGLPLWPFPFRLVVGVTGLGGAAIGLPGGF